MRFLANENLPGEAIAALKHVGHDVVWVRTAAPGSKDEIILAWAMREGRVLLTIDKDSGIILFQLPMPTAGRVGAVIVARIGERTDWNGHFSVIEPGRTRMRRLAAR